MSTISKACLEISKSLRNFKFNRGSSPSDNQKEISDQTRTGSQPGTTNQTSGRSNDLTLNSGGELSVTEALTRVFRQATSRVRSFSDRGCSQSFPSIAPEVNSSSSSSPSSSFPVVPLPPPFFPVPPPSPASTVNTFSSEVDLNASDASSPALAMEMSVQGRVASLPSSPCVKTRQIDGGGGNDRPQRSLRSVPSDPFPPTGKVSRGDSVTVRSRTSPVRDLWQDENFLVRFFGYVGATQPCTLAQVCRVWREVLYSDARYWTKVAAKVNCRELGRLDEQGRSSFYASLERRRFDSLCLVGLLDEDVEDLARLFPYARRGGIKKLSVRCSNVTDPGLKRLVTETTVGLTSLELNGCNEITEAGLWGCLDRGLTSLSLADCINVADESVAAVARLLPDLVEFNLQAYHVTDSALSAFGSNRGARLETLRLLSCWEVTNHGVVNVIRSLPNLTVLSLSGCSKITDDGVEVLAENLRHLKSLDLSWCSRITDASLEYIACDLCLLEELTLDRCSHVSDIGVGYLSTMTSLTHLFLRWCTQVRDFGLQRISNMKNLRVLSLAGCSMVTSGGISRLSHLTTLRELELTNCPATSSSDICSFLHDKMPNCIIIE